MDALVLLLRAIGRRGRPQFEASAKCAGKNSKRSPYEGQGCGRRGELIPAGPLSDPLDTGVILFEADSAEVNRNIREARSVCELPVHPQMAHREWAAVVDQEVFEKLWPNS